MGLLDKATEFMDGATNAVGGVMSDIDILKLLTVVDLVWENKDALVDLLTRLPRTLGDAGDSMQAAGVGARQAGSLLSGEVRTITLEAATTLEACRRPLGQVAEVFDEIGALLERIPLLGNVAEPVTQGLRAIREVSDSVEAVLAQVRELGERLGDVGTGLDAMAGSLELSGSALATLSGRGVIDKVAPRRPASAAPKARAKAKAKATATDRPKAASKATSKAAPSRTRTAGRSTGAEKKPTRPKAPGSDR